MEKEIIFKVRIDNTKDAKFTLEKIDEVSDLIGIDKIEMEIRNKRGLLSVLRGLWRWIVS